MKFNRFVESMDKKKNIIMLTNYYPFSEVSEVFITPELNAIDYSKWNVKLLATCEGKNREVKQDCPSAVEIRAIGKPAFSAKYKFLLLFKILIRVEFYKEIFMLICTGKAKLKNIKKLMYFCANSIDKYNSIFKILKEEGYMSSNKEKRNLLLYSYWMNESAYAVAMLSRKLGFPAICRVHGADFYEERNDGYLPMRRFIVQQMKRIYPASNAGRNYLIERYGNAGKIEYNYLGSENTNGLRPISTRIPFCIVSCAYMVPLKRISAIAEAICGIKDAQIVWIHFGDGPEFSQIKNIISSTKDNIKCILRGNVTSTELMNFYLHNDVHLFVNYSTTEGGVPQSIKEAMSFGIPAIATDVGGNPEIIRNHINGLLLEVDSGVEQLRKSIVSFIRMPEKEYTQYRIEAFNEWKTRFDAAKTFPQFYEGLEKII